MKSKIYIIKNDINSKVYIGQTTKSIEERLKKHKEDSLVSRKLRRPLYNAMRKYGKDKFHISLIEECDMKNADEREVFWIGYYKSNAENGYNATVGGKTYKPYDYEMIADLLKAKYKTKEIMKKTGCCKQLVYRVAKEYGIEIFGGKVDVELYQATLENEIVHKFPNIASAAEYIKNSSMISANVDTIRKNINRCINDSKRISAYGYVWYKASV